MAAQFARSHQTRVSERNLLRIPKQRRDRAVEAADYARKSSAFPVQIDPVAIDRFTRLMREPLISGDIAAASRLSSSFTV